MSIAPGISHNFSSRKPTEYEEKYKELKQKYDELSEKYNELVARHQRMVEEFPKWGSNNIIKKQD